MPEKVSVSSKISSGVGGVFTNLKKLFAGKPRHKPEPKPESKIKPIKIGAPEHEEKISMFSRMHASVTTKTQKLRSFFYVKPKVEIKEKLPEKVLEKVPEKAVEKLPITGKSKFRFSWENIKESYRKMMEREKKFVTRKLSVTPSLQMQALKEKVRVVAEEEKITPKLLREEVESIKKIVEERKKFKIYLEMFW